MNQYIFPLQVYYVPPLMLQFQLQPYYSPSNTAPVLYITPLSSTGGCWK